jgi:hypothetical protein
MQMATVSGAGGDISVAFLQQNGDDPFTATPERTAQIAGVAKLIADFIAGARKSLDIAIYDFRLGDDAAARAIMSPSASFTTRPRSPKLTVRRNCRPLISKPTARLLAPRRS